MSPPLAGRRAVLFLPGRRRHHPLTDGRLLSPLSGGELGWGHCSIARPGVAAYGRYRRRPPLAGIAGGAPQTAIARAAACGNCGRRARRRRLRGRRGHADAPWDSAGRAGALDCVGSRHASCVVHDARHRHVGRRSSPCFSATCTLLGAATADSAAGRLSIRAPIQ